MNKKFRMGIVAGAAAGLVFLAAVQCSSEKSHRGAPSAVTQPGGDPVILQVKDSVCRVSDFDRYVQASVGSGIRGMDDSVLGKLFDEFVDQKLLLEAAREQGLTVSLADKRDYLTRLGEGTLTEEEKTLLLTADSGPFIDQILADLYVRMIVNHLTVEDAEIRDYYERNQKEFFLPERAAISQILLRTEQEALEIWDQLRTSSEETFRQVARSKSVGPEAAAGGAMGVFQKGQLPSEMDAAVLALGEHEISPVIESSYGFHIFRVDKKYPAETISLEAATPSIKTRLMEVKSQSAVSRHLEELEARFNPVIYPENLPFLYKRTPS